MVRLDKCARDWVEGRSSEMVTIDERMASRISWFNYVTASDDKMLDRMGYKKYMKRAPLT